MSSDPTASHSTLSNSILAALAESAAKLSTWLSAAVRGDSTRPRFTPPGSRVLLEVFSNRVELTSPGALPNHMRAEAVLAGAHPRSRNELLANFLAVKGYMEMRGRGLPIIRKEML